MRLLELSQRFLIDAVIIHVGMRGGEMVVVFYDFWISPFCVERVAVRICWRTKQPHFTRFFETPWIVNCANIQHQTKQHLCTYSCVALWHPSQNETTYVWCAQCAHQLTKIFELTASQLSQQQCRCSKSNSTIHNWHFFRIFCDNRREVNTVSRGH